MNPTQRILAVCSALVFATSCSDPGGAPQSARSSNVEIFSVWTEPGEAEALAALLEVVRQKQPELNVINSVTSLRAASAEVKEVLTNRLLEGNPPDSFQIHGGAELIQTWVSVSGDDSQNRMEPLDFLYDSEQWRRVFPPKLVELLSYRGRVYSVPVNIHRGNVLYYNTAVFADLGLQPPRTWADFFVVSESIKRAGKVPLALGGKDSFSMGMLFENALLANGGAAYYVDYFKGLKSPAGDPAMIDTLVLLDRVMQNVQPDPFTRGWAEAAELVRTGEAAMIIMGDWCKGYLQTKMRPGIDFASVPAPDTQGSFVVITDTFGLPIGAPNRDNAIALLKIIGSREGGDAFNPLKGSIPARTDGDRSRYDDIAQQAIADYAEAGASVDPNKGLVPSMAHGSAAPQAYVSAVAVAIDAYVRHLDGARLAQDLVNAYPRLTGR